MSRDGDALLVPVRLNGKDRWFMIDTGAYSTALVDVSVPLGKSRESVSFRTAGGMTKAGVYDMPDATVGGLPLGVVTVLGADLKSIREVFGLPVEGLIGMDFLSRHIVHIDFDRGKLLLLKAVPRVPAARLCQSRRRSGSFPKSMFGPRLTGKFASQSIQVGSAWTAG